MRFATLVLDAFEAAGHSTDTQVIAAGGPSTTTLTMLRKVRAGEWEMPEPRNPTWSKIEDAARWPRGTASCALPCA